MKTLTGIIVTKRSEIITTTTWELKEEYVANAIRTYLGCAEEAEVEFNFGQIFEGVTVRHTVKTDE